MARPAEMPTIAAVADAADAWLLDLPQRGRCRHSKALTSPATAPTRAKTTAAGTA